MSAPPSAFSANTSHASDFLTVTELAERLGVSRAHAYRLIAQGTIPVVTLGRTIRIPVRAYERWLAEQAATAAKAALR